MSSTREICGTEGFYGDLEKDKANAAIVADAPAMAELLSVAEKMLCDQENALREMGCYEPSTEFVILGIRDILAKHKEV